MILYQIFERPENITFWQALYRDQWAVEIFGGLFTSFLFVLVVYLLRPKFKISGGIAKVVDNGTISYVIKVVNNSYFKAIDVNFEMFILRPVNAPKGQNLKIKRINLRADKFWYLRGKRLFGKHKGYATNAILVTVTEDLDVLWDNESDFLTFKVIARHGFSGFPKIQKMKYDHKATTIKTGRFEWGKSVDIV